MTPDLAVGIETSTRAASIALAAGGRLLEEHRLAADSRATAELLPRLDLLLRRHGFTARQIETVCFSQGPGSFTGLRIAATIARMLHAALGCRVVAVSTLEALARGAVGAGAAPDVIVPMLDARRGQIFAAAYRRTSDREALDTAAAVGLYEPRALLEGLPRPVRVLGEGVAAYRAVCEAAGAEVLPEVLWTPRAAQVVALGLRRAAAGAYCRAEEIVPLYVRPPECEEVYERRRAEARARRS